MEPLTFHDGRVELYAEDCLAVLKVLPDCFVDAVITDPPYHLTSIVRRFANAKPEAEAYAAKSNSAYMSRGFMGQRWDGGDIAFRPDVWRECLRVLKPGGHLASFSGTRTYHRMACAIEDAGFEIRDQLAWTYGSGFPKSHDVSKGIDKAAATEDRLSFGSRQIGDGVKYNPIAVERMTPGEQSSLGRFPANLVHDGSPEVLAGFPETGVSSGGNTGKPTNVYGDYAGLGGGAIGFGDRGSAARFFYCAKANKKDRAGSNHPTVKPISLIAWLVRMLTPPGGLVLDPFAGTGTLAAATFQENKRAILIEREELYRSDIVRRVEALAA